jgi:hypothetical protein
MLIGDEQGVRLHLGNPASANANSVVARKERMEPIEAGGNCLNADNALSKMIKIRWRLRSKNCPEALAKASAYQCNEEGRLHFEKEKAA